MSQATKITDALVERLKTITQSEGAATDVGRVVYRGTTARGVLATSTEGVPLTVIRSTSESGEYTGPKRGVRSREIVIEALLTDDGFLDHEAATDAALDDLLTVLYPQRAGVVLDGLVRSLTVEGVEFDHPDDAGEIAVVSVTLTAVYAAT